ncbi:hypothetical protein [Hamadaea tsunoensis]|uniref:hypothetical protein n=1 Tax=Hamadaea tsunoensis TaxID=53368 RepID=UPI0003FE783A|nr:hypothetical protein [Hamadaea tsunoensis]
MSAVHVDYVSHQSFNQLNHQQPNHHQLNNQQPSQQSFHQRVAGHQSRNPLAVYETSSLDAARLRALACDAAGRVFRAVAPATPWWRRNRLPAARPDGLLPRYRHLYERFTEGALNLDPYFNVKAGPSLRLRGDGVILYATYRDEYDGHTLTYSDERPATDEELLLADYYYELAWTEGRERTIQGSIPRLIVSRKGQGLERILSGML